MGAPYIAYRLVVGEQGNEQGHIVGTRANTLEEAERALKRQLRGYKGNGWGRIEIDDFNDGRWQRMD